MNIDALRIHLDRAANVALKDCMALFAGVEGGLIPAPEQTKLLTPSRSP